MTDSERLELPRIEANRAELPVARKTPATSLDPIVPKGKWGCLVLPWLVFGAPLIMAGILMSLGLLGVGIFHMDLQWAAAGAAELVVMVAGAFYWNKLEERARRRG